MINQIDHIVEHLFRKKRLDDVSVYELERFIATHPYFAAGHFLLAKKTQSSQPEHTSEKVATTALYYNNALWLQWLLDQDLSNAKRLEEKELSQIILIILMKRFFRYKTIDPDISVDQEEAEIIGQTEENIERIETSSSDSDHDTTQVNEFPLASENFTDLSPSEHEEETAYAYQPEAFNNNSTEQIIEGEIEMEKEFRSSEQNVSTLDEPEVKTDMISSQTEIPIEEAEPVNDIAASDETATSENTSTEENPDEQTLTDIVNESIPVEQNNAEEAESRASAASIERTLTTAALIPTRAEIEKNEFTFEPYHTIDYFASQGIKLQQSDLSKDKFGKQLKSFTEWLRSMKRLPQAAVEANMDEATQQSIQNIAEHSFEEKEIVTETMAEVWIKQGNKEKAIDTLNKLSLLNPSKSHYFAAKIEQLKAS